MPDTIISSDGRILNRLNLWSTLYVGDAGKSSENITMTGFDDIKLNINRIDEMLDLGEEMTLSGFEHGMSMFNNTVWVAESFSYTRDVPGGYSYSLSLERVR
jgi:hypothetical protein